MAVQFQMASRSSCWSPALLYLGLVPARHSRSSFTPLLLPRLPVNASSGHGRGSILKSALSADGNSSFDGKDILTTNTPSGQQAAQQGPAEAKDCSDQEGQRQHSTLVGSMEDNSFLRMLPDALCKALEARPLLRDTLALMGTLNLSQFYATYRPLLSFAEYAPLIEQLPLSFRSGCAMLYTGAMFVAVLVHLAIAAVYAVSVARALQQRPALGVKQWLDKYYMTEVCVYNILCCAACKLTAQYATAVRSSAAAQPVAELLASKLPPAIDAALVGEVLASGPLMFVTVIIFFNILRMCWRLLMGLNKAELTGAAGGGLGA